MTSLIEVKVPDIGDFSDVDVIEVHVAAGDEIAPEDSLITLETEKAAMDVPSPAADRRLPPPDRRLPIRSSLDSRPCWIVILTGESVQLDSHPTG